MYLPGTACPWTVEHGPKKQLLQDMYITESLHGIVCCPQCCAVETGPSLAAVLGERWNTIWLVALPAL